MLISSALVLLMIPGISLFYAGLTDRSSTLTVLRLPFITAAFASFQVSQMLPRIMLDEGTNKSVAPVGLFPYLFLRIWGHFVVRYRPSNRRICAYVYSTSRC